MATVIELTDDEWGLVKDLFDRPGGWSGVPSPGPRGMEVEVSGGLARVVLEEQSSYTVRISGPVTWAGLRSPSGAPLTGAGASEAVFRIDTGNLVGLSALATETADGFRLPDLPLRIRVRKLGDPDADFTWLVDSIVESIRALALTTQSPTALGVERLKVGDPYPYEDLVFLRAIAGDVERAVRRITQNPHRRIVERREVVDAWLAREVSPSDLVSVAADGRNLAVVEPEQQLRLLGVTAASAFTRAVAI
jgi:Domain of unknown function (DUF2357)